MENVAVSVVAALAVVTAASGAPVPEHQGVYIPPFIPPNAPVTEVRCRLNENCTLPCPFEGQYQGAWWVHQDNPKFPIVIEPPFPGGYLNRDYLGRASMSRQQSGEGAALMISEVQMKHQGVYKCSVNSSSGHIDRYINLRVYSDAAADNPALRYLWILLLLVPVAVVVGLLIRVVPVLVVVGVLIRYHQELHQKLCKKNTPTSGGEGADIRLNSEGDKTTAGPVENRLPNGLSNETKL